MVAMTTPRLAVQAVFLCLHIYYNGFFYVCATTITVPDPGFSKKALEFIQVTKTLEWAKAADVCSKDFQGSLVKVDTIEERDALEIFVNDESVGNHFWVGLQRSGGSGGVTVWNDNECTPVNAGWDNYKDANSQNFQNNKQCFAAHDTSKLNWEAFGCTEKKHFVCERRTVVTTVDANIDFRVVMQNNSDHASCASLCATLSDCFISSSIVSACVVGLAASSPNTKVIVVGGTAGGQTVSNAASGAQANTQPDPCVVGGGGGGGAGEVTMTLDDYILIDGDWQQTEISATPPQCPSASPVVSHVYVATTITETSVRVDTTTSPVEVNTCSNNDAGASAIIVATTVTHVMTSVAVETTTVPTYVTVTAQIAASSCTDNSVIHTTTVNSCQVSSAPVVTNTISPSSGSSSQSTQTTVSVNSEITDRLRSEIYDSLYVNKDDLSKTLRAKNSANNKLTSSVAIGFSFSLMCVIFIAVIILSDMRAILMHIKTRMWVNIRSLSRSY